MTVPQPAAITSHPPPAVTPDLQTVGRSDGLSSHDPSFRQVLARVARYAACDHVTILLEGESGTGKNFLARRVHALSPRASGPFREVSLAACDDALAGSELFGHERGAFTDARQRRVGHFVSADGGTLFLDELGKASPVVQRKLLRVLETGECWPVGADRSVPVRVRLVAATNVSLPTLVARDQFLPDLYARLGCCRIVIPPLRERRADIPALVEGAIRRHAPLCGYEGDGPIVDPELMEVLIRAPWPYNIRQLEGTILRLLIDACGAPVLTPALCVDDLTQLAADPIAPGTFDVRLSAHSVSDDQMERAVREAGSVSAAARRLGVHRATIYRRIGNDGVANAQARTDDSAPPAVPAS